MQLKGNTAGTGGRGYRRAVGEFNPAMARRLLTSMRAVNLDQLTGVPLFAHLTYPGEFDTNPRRWKLDWHTFWKRLERAFPGVACHWIMEFQKRGAPHFHLVLYNLQPHQLPALRTWFSVNWYEVVGSGDLRHLRAGTQVGAIRSWGGVTSYMSGYVAKMHQKKLTVPEGVGRWWGVRGKKHLGIAWEEHEVTWQQFHRLRRVARKWQHSTNRTRKHRNRPGASYTGCTVYVRHSTVKRLLSDLRGHTAQTEGGSHGG